MVDPRVWPYARLAAAIVNGGRAAAPSVVAGVVAQWTCESGHGWPPARNNPANLARGFVAGLGVPYTVGEPNPQPGNPIVTFATIAAGASAYARGLVAIPRYAPAIARARAGDGKGFADAVCRAGFGTSQACVDSVYAGLVVPPPPAPRDNIECRSTVGAMLRTGPGQRYPAVRSAHHGSTAHKLGTRVGQPYTTTYGPGVLWTSVDRLDGRPLGRTLWTADRLWVNR